MTNRNARSGKPAQIRPRHIAAGWQSARNCCLTDHMTPPDQSVTVLAQWSQTRAKACDCCRIYCWHEMYRPTRRPSGAACAPQPSEWTLTSHWTWRPLGCHLREEQKSLTLDMHVLFTPNCWHCFILTQYFFNRLRLCTAGGWGCLWKTIGTLTRRK